MYQAHILHTYTNMAYDTKEQAYIGLEDTCHVINTETINSSTLESLLFELNKRYSILNPDGIEIQIFDNTIDISFEGEHDYRTPKSEQVPFFENIQIKIEQYTPTEVDLSTIKPLNHIERY